MNKEEIKQFIKDNLQIEVIFQESFCLGGNSHVVSLRFKDDKDSFSSDSISVGD